MPVINATNARKDIYKIIADVNANSTSYTITSKNGENAVLLSERDWENIQETIYLNSIPGFVEMVNEGRAENTEDCMNLEDVEW